MEQLQRVYDEFLEDVRRYQNQRKWLLIVNITVASALLGLVTCLAITVDGYFQPSLLIICLWLVGLGAAGWLLSAKLSERIVLHQAIKAKVGEELEATARDAERPSRPLSELLQEAEATHSRYFRWPAAGPENNPSPEKSHSRVLLLYESLFWEMFHALILVAGILLTIKLLATGNLR